MKNHARRIWLYTLFGVDIRLIGKYSNNIEESFIESRKYDSMSWLIHWTLKDEDGGPPKSMTCIDRLKEDTLVGTLFSELEQYGSTDDIIAGWRLNSLVWPRLVNTAVRLRLAIPQSMRWAKMDPCAKWSGGKFYDLYSIYTQGSFDRPQIELHEALNGWTGEHMMTDRELYADQLQRIPLVDLSAHSDRVINLMQEVAMRYDY